MYSNYVLLVRAYSCLSVIPTVFDCFFRLPGWFLTHVGISCSGVEQGTHLGSWGGVSGGVWSEHPESAGRWRARCGR